MMRLREENCQMIRNAILLLDTVIEIFGLFGF